MSLRRSLLGACVAALMVAAPAQADVINVTQDFEMTTENCLTHEVVTYQQPIHFVVKTDGVDADGNPVIVFFHQDLLNAQGVGETSGDHYVIHTQLVSTGDPLDGTKPATSVVSFHVIDTGTGADSEVGGTLHTTINANGDLTVLHSTGSFRCGDDHLHVGVQL